MVAVAPSSARQGGSVSPAVPRMAAAQENAPAVESRERVNSYADLLRHHGFTIELRGPWAGNGHSQRTQGWKLHISAIPIQARQLLSAIVPILRMRQVPFKVARDEGMLSLLNEGAFGATQIGKFITVYPLTDTDSRPLAEELIAATDHFDGPAVLTDLQLGRVVYTRYGGFNPDLQRDRLGHVYSVLRDAGGFVRPDQRAVPFVQPNGVANPFSEIAKAHRTVLPGAGRGKLFGPGYLLLRVIKPNAKGSVFLALDMQDQTRVAAKVIKEGRAHCMSDRYGRDIRNRLQHQLTLHRALAGRICVPTADTYFEVAGNGYLVLDYLDGVDFGASIGDYFGALLPAQQQQLISRFAVLAEVIDGLHAAGCVHRDLAPTNIRIRPDGSIYLLDLELTHLLKSDTLPFTQGTPGFMSPEQQAGMPPTCADDVFGLGALMVLFFTGIDPRRVLFGTEQGRVEQLCVLGDLPAELASLVARCVGTEPGQRANLAEVGDVLNRAAAALHWTGATHDKGGRTATGLTIEKTQALAHRCLSAAARGLLHGVSLDTQSGLWLSPLVQGSTHAPADLTSNYALHRSASRGVAGVVYALARLARFGFAELETRERVERAIDWLLTHAPTPDDQLPGLHFGEAGVALAIVEAVRSGLIERGAWLDKYLDEALEGPLDWPDVTHGAAGQGIAALACGDVLQDARLASRSSRCAQYLIETQEPDGGWMLPEGVAAMTGSRYTGFAHGVAGEVYFLAEYAARFNNVDAAQAARRGAHWLAAHAERTGGPGNTLSWPIKLNERQVWKWWCHGAPGIALTFLKLFETTGEDRYAEVAVAGLHAHPSNIRYSNFSQCHGLSGLGEIYLEAARVLGGEAWLFRAARIGEVLFWLAHENEGRVTWLVEDPYRATGDLMIGCAGVAHFLLRLCHDGLSGPLLLDGCCRGARAASLAGKGVIARK